MNKKEQQKEFATRFLGLMSQNKSLTIPKSGDTIPTSKQKK